MRQDVNMKVVSRALRDAELEVRAVAERVDLRSIKSGFVELRQAIEARARTLGDPSRRDDDFERVEDLIAEQVAAWLRGSYGPERTIYTEIEMPELLIKDGRDV